MPPATSTTVSTAVSLNLGVTKTSVNLPTWCTVVVAKRNEAHNQGKIKRFAKGGGGCRRNSRFSFNKSKSDQKKYSFVDMTH